jgi:DNA replication protein DnaC
MSASPRRCCQPRCPPATATAARAASRPRGSPRKTLEEFDFTFQRSVKKTVVEHLGQLDFLHARENVILLGPPGPASHCTSTVSR